MNLRIWSLYVSGAKPEKGSKNAALRERGEGSGSESNDDEADKDDHSPKGYGQAGVFCQKNIFRVRLFFETVSNVAYKLFFFWPERVPMSFLLQVKKNKTPKDADKRTKDDSGDENPKGKKAMKAGL